MAFTREQLQNAARLVQTAKRKGATPKETKALLEASIVESGVRHLKYGDRDSKGILQQRVSQGWGPASESIEQDAAQFLAKAKQAKGRTPGQLAQAVQRSAYPGRYDERSKEAEALLAKAGGSLPSAQTMAYGRGAPAAGEDPTQAKAALFAKYSAQRGKPGALLNLVSGVKAAEAGASTPTDVGAGSKEQSNPVSASDIVGIGKIAQEMGLKVGEQSAFGGKPTAGHVPDSYHYKDQAIDVSGDPEKMQAFNDRIASMGPKLKELFYNGPSGKNYKDGKPVKKGFVSGHTDHVHVAM